MLLLLTTETTPAQALAAATFFSLVSLCAVKVQSQFRQI